MGTPAHCFLLLPGPRDVSCLWQTQRYPQRWGGCPGGTTDMCIYKCTCKPHPCMGVGLHSQSPGVVGLGPRGSPGVSVNRGWGVCGGGVFRVVSPNSATRLGAPPVSAQVPRGAAGPSPLHHPVLRSRGASRGCLSLNGRAARTEESPAGAEHRPLPAPSPAWVSLKANWG